MKITKQIREDTKSLGYITNRNYLHQMQFLKLEHFIILILSFNESNIQHKSKHFKSISQDFWIQTIFILRKIFNY